MQQEGGLLIALNTSHRQDTLWQSSSICNKYSKGTHTHAQNGPGNICVPQKTIIKRLTMNPKVEKI